MHTVGAAEDVDHIPDQTTYAGVSDAVQPLECARYILVAVVRLYLHQSIGKPEILCEGGRQIPDQAPLVVPGCIGRTQPDFQVLERAVWKAAAARSALLEGR